MATSNDLTNEVLYAQQLMEHSKNYSALLKFGEQLQRTITYEYEGAVYNKHFKPNTSLARKKWYFKHLHERVCLRNYKIWKADIFSLVEQSVSEILPKMWNNSMKYFMPIGESGAIENAYSVLAVRPETCEQCIHHTFLYPGAGRCNLTQKITRVHRGKYCSSFQKRRI